MTDTIEIKKISASELVHENSLNRVIALSLFYQALVLKNTNEEIMKYAYEHDDFEIEGTHAEKILQGSLTKREKLEKIIAMFTTNRPLFRYNKVIQACIMIGTYEIMSTATDHSIIINEWVEIAKVYSPDDSFKLVNAILDGISKKKNGK